MLNVGFEVFLDFSLGRTCLNAKRRFPFRKQFLGPLELVFHGIAFELLLKRLRQAAAADDHNRTACHRRCQSFHLGSIGVSFQTASFGISGPTLMSASFQAPRTNQPDDKAGNRIVR